MDDVEERVVRIVYASESNVRESVYAELERIRASALEHNVPLGVNTALLYQSGWFVQWKEGAADAVRDLMDRVGADPRHRNLRILHSSRGPRLLSGPWSMALVDAGETHSQMEERVAWLLHGEFHGRRLSPVAVWRQVSTPHVAAVRVGDPDAFRRITVCAAESKDAFSLVQWLGRRYDRPVVHRRYAGDEGLDVGTDYVDLEEDGHPYRVVAMARTGLQLPLTRALLADHAHIVLLLRGDRQRVLGLVHRACEACPRTGPAPALTGIGADPAMLEVAGMLATHCHVPFSGIAGDPEHALGVWMLLRNLPPGP